MKQHKFMIPALCCLLAGCAGQPAGQDVRTVLVVQPEATGAVQTKVFSGVVKEAGEIKLGFKTPGQLATIVVDEGDYVRKGQLIATLDDADYRLGVEAVEIQCKQLADEVKRLEQLYRGKSISANDYEKAVAGLKQLEVQLQVNRNKLDYTRLYAPTDGYVLQVNFDEAEMVDAGTPVIDLLDVNGMEVGVDVPADIYARRGQIDSVVCRTLSAPWRDWQLKLLSLAPKADATQLYRMRLGFGQQGAEAMPVAGMNVEVELHFAAADSARTFALPLRAVFREDGANYVWVVGSDSLSHKTLVTLRGLDENGTAAWVTGLEGDEAVVKAGTGALTDGQRVRIGNEPSDSNVGGLL